MGERLGLYRVLAESGASISSELAARTGTTERYMRELLEHHAAECVARCFVSTPFQARFSEVEVLPIETD